MCWDLFKSYLVQMIDGKAFLALKLTRCRIDPLRRPVATIKAFGLPRPKPEGHDDPLLVSCLNVGKGNYLLMRPDLRKSLRSDFRLYHIRG